MSDDGKSKPRILVVDDSRLIRVSFVKYLGDEFEVVQCEDGDKALATLEADTDFSLIFSDLSMPRMDGYQLLEHIRNNHNPAICDIPVIIVTGKEDGDQDKERILAMGATDLISKPFHSSELVSRARGYANLRKRVVKLEREVPLDPLTGLATRDHFMEQGGKQLALARRQHFKLTVAYLTVANLAELRQEFGASLTAKMIAVVAKALRDIMRVEDIAAHFGRGEFALLLPGADIRAIAQVWARLRQRIAHFELKVGERTARLVFGSGVSSHDIDDSVTCIEQLVQKAEEALRASSSTVSAEAPESPVSEAATSVPAGVAEVSIDALLEQLRQNQPPSPEQSAAALHALVPLLKLINEQLGLELGAALNALPERLHGT